MKTASNIGRRKWVIIPMKVMSKGMYHIDYKFPANVAICDGFMLSVLQPITDLDFKRLGELSLQINTHKVHPMHIVVDYFVNEVAPKKQPFSLDIPIEQGSIISGFYRDFSGKDYTLNIYLACRLNPEKQ